MLELMPLKPLKKIVKKITKLPTTEQFVQQVQDAYAKTGLKPATGSRKKNGYACAVGVILAQQGYDNCIVDFKGNLRAIFDSIDFTIGVEYGFDGVAASPPEFDCENEAHY